MGHRQMNEAWSFNYSMDIHQWFPIAEIKFEAKGDQVLRIELKDIDKTVK